uniref:Uncharacterized protein n=1 Tax=Alexandrium catenella TaxID=2925 RepID=A0A6T9AF71_ALECA|mmetsp:Transcript_107768/g.286889  ORF Transcript_107768/g.286889 Transcript_107768/m.286889 type:complete len:219 (+) Transcript_107768:71-727(+)
MAVLAGCWSTPLAMIFNEDDEGCTSENGDIRLRLDQETLSVTLMSGDQEVTGKLINAGTRIRWMNGATWSKPVEREVTLEQPDLLSDRQLDGIIDRINESFNVIFLSESMERSLIEGPVKQVNGMLKECLGSIMVEDWKLALETLLDETKASEGKIAIVQDVLGRQLRDPLTEALNGKINFPLLTEGMEEKMLRTVVDKVLDRMVAAAVLGMEETGFV